jgi:hypothetical protein
VGFISGVAERDGWHEATFVLNTDKPLWDVARDLLRVGTPVSIGAKSLFRDESLADLGLATPVRRHTTAVLQEVSILSPGGDGREEITYPNGGPPLARRNIGEVLGVR